jgi:hypothetical protein
MKWNCAALLLAVAAVASAGTVVVYPGQGWAFGIDKGVGGSGQFVRGGTPPLGEGSAEIAVTGNNAEVLYTLGYGGVRFDSITELAYSTYRSSGGSPLALSLQFDVDTNLTDSLTNYQGRLVFEPYFSHTVLDDTWQTWDALQGANWWFSKGTLIPSNTCVQGSVCTWAQVLAEFPNAGVLPGYGTMFKAGSAWTNFDGNVDNFTIGINGASTTFDFEPAPEPATWSLFAIGAALVGLARRYRK